MHTGHIIMLYIHTNLRIRNHINIIPDAINEVICHPKARNRREMDYY